MSTPPPVEKLWGTREVQEYLRVGRSMVYELVARGELPHTRVGSRIRFEADQVRAWVARQRSTSQGARVVSIAGGKR